MKAIRIHAFGAPEVMKLEDVETPKPSAGQVLVRIEAAGVNPADTYARSGNYAKAPPLPYTPGTDGAGIIEAVGEGVDATVGARVLLTRSITGTYAELALAVANQIMPLPEHVSFAQGAGVAVPYATAHRALKRIAHGRGGEMVLVHGASGGVGVAAVQTARAMGMTILGTAGTAEGRDLVKREGADHVFDHHDPKYREAILATTHGRGVDVILEMLANVNLGHDLELLAMRGRVVVIGSRGDVTITPRQLMSRDASIHGMLLWNASEPDMIDAGASIHAGLANRTLRPIVGKEIPLAEAPRAHVEVLAPGAFGKIVLVP